jgi:FtsZ-interacting cell division protein ZipA
MRQFLIPGAMALSALLAGTAAQARQTQAQPQVQTPQQTRQANQARQQAESFLRKEESAATGRQTQSTDRANQDAAVADEAAGHSDAARPARSTNPNALPPSTRPSGSRQGPSYGPVLNPRQPQAGDPARKDPAEVHDETDSLTREAPQSQQPKQKQQKQARQAPRRREAWQPAGPLAPRPLSGNEAAAIGYGAVPVPAPAQAPQPVLPSTTPLNSCVGGACRDAAGATYNLGTTGSGVNSAGRPCTRNGATVQCL